MKTAISMLIALFITSTIARADYLEDVKNFGYVAGEGIACNSPRYKSYGMVTQAYLISASKSDDELQKGMYAYNEAKATSFIRMKDRKLRGCAEVRERFEKQKIFQTKLSKNGTLRMPDGKVIKPRQAYDTTKIYDKNADEKARLDEIYNKAVAKRKRQLVKEGIYEKIKKAEAEAQSRH